MFVLRVTVNRKWTCSLWTTSGKNDNACEGHLVLRGSTSKLGDKVIILPKCLFFIKHNLKLPLKPKF